MIIKLAALLSEVDEDIIQGRIRMYKVSMICWIIEFHKF